MGLVKRQIVFQQARVILCQAQPDIAAHAPRQHDNTFGVFGQPVFVYDGALSDMPTQISLGYQQGNILIPIIVHGQQS